MTTASKASELVFDLIVVIQNGVDLETGTFFVQFLETVDILFCVPTAYRSVLVLDRLAQPLKGHVLNLHTQITSFLLQ